MTEANLSLAAAKKHSLFHFFSVSVGLVESRNKYKIQMDSFFMPSRSSFLKNWCTVALVVLPVPTFCRFTPIPTIPTIGQFKATWTSRGPGNHPILCESRILHPETSLPALLTITFPCHGYWEQSPSKRFDLTMWCMFYLAVHWNQNWPTINQTQNAHCVIMKKYLTVMKVVVDEYVCLVYYSGM